MNYAPNRNGKSQEETLADFNSYAVKTTFRQRCFKMTLPLFQVFQKFLPNLLLLCNIQKRVLGMAL